VAGGRQVNLNLSTEELRDLIIMTYMAEWVMDAYKTEADPRTARFKELEQKLLKLALEAGLNDLVMYDEDLKMHFPTRLMEDGTAREFIDEYNNETFWDELANRLATRDFVKRYGSPEAAWNLPVERRFIELGEIEARYVDEFVDHGLERIKIGRR
jgi:hypothetical protein